MPPGNPDDISEAAQRACPDAIRALHEVVLNRRAPAAARVNAASALLDRGFGKPVQTINANLASKRPSEMTRAELDTAIAALLVEEAAQDDAPDPERLN